MTTFHVKHQPTGTRGGAPGAGLSGCTHSSAHSGGSRGRRRRPMSSRSNVCVASTTVLCGRACRHRSHDRRAVGSVGRDPVRGEHVLGTRIRGSPFHVKHRPRLGLHSRKQFRQLRRSLTPGRCVPAVSGSPCSRARASVRDLNPWHHSSALLDWARDGDSICSSGVGSDRVGMPSEEGRSSPLVPRRPVVAGRPAV